MKKYKFELIGFENENFNLPIRAESFIVDAYEIGEALRNADKKLYQWDVIGYLDDYTDDDYNNEETQCSVSFCDFERGWSIRYKVEEI